jgi:hypothetical protein
MKKERKTNLNIILAALAATLVLIAIACSGGLGHLKTKDELLNYKNAAASLVLSEDGEQEAFSGFL